MNRSFKTAIAPNNLNDVWQKGSWGNKYLIQLSSSFPISSYYLPFSKLSQNIRETSWVDIVAEEEKGYKTVSPAYPPDNKQFSLGELSRLYIIAFSSTNKVVPFCNNRDVSFSLTIGKSGSTVQFSSVQSLSRVQLFATPWIAAHQASLSIIISRSPLRLTSIESVMPSSHLILCRPLLLLPPIPPSISLFQWANSSHEVAKVLEFQL